MKLQTVRHAGGVRKETCYVHTRGLLLPGGFGILTMQRLQLSGVDVFYGIEMRKTTDGGAHFSAPVPCRHLGRRVLEDGTSCVMCDATPFYHRATGKILLTGHMAWYGENNKLLRTPRARAPLYAVYNEEIGDFDAFRELALPEEVEGEFFSAGAGCTQMTEAENGELLLPFYALTTGADGKDTMIACVARCAFDGERLQVLAVGDRLGTPLSRGFCEPSIVRAPKGYLLALRNDESGFVAFSHDGLSYGEPRRLCFDDGEHLGNYNTQQHWLTGGGRLWLVYTRRAENNGHVFRHRAPLFVAEFDPAGMCVIRATERIAVPERGARLGNFGCQSYSEEEGLVFVSEWMQNDPYGWDECAKRGSDNSIFVTRVLY